MSNELAKAAAEGFLVNPPDARGNTQRIFVPRSAIAELTVLAVIGGPQRRRKPAEKPAEEQRQAQMFE